MDVAFRRQHCRDLFLSARITQKLLFFLSNRVKLIVLFFKKTCMYVDVVCPRLGRVLAIVSGG